MPSKSRSASASKKTKKYVLLKQATLLKNKTLSKQGKEISTTRSPSQWVAMYAMALYSKKYKQLRSAFLYRKGTVYRYSITFHTKSGRKCATAKLTSRSVCKVTGGKPGKSRSCHPHGLSAKKKALAKAKSDQKKAEKSVSSSKKRVSKAKKSLEKTKSGSSSRAKAKLRVKKASKELSSTKKSLSKLKAQVKKKSKEVKRMSKSR